MRGLCVWCGSIKALQLAIAFSESVAGWSPMIQATALDDSKHQYFHAVPSAKASGDVYNRYRGVTLSIDSGKAVAFIVLLMNLC